MDKSRRIYVAVKIGGAGICYSGTAVGLLLDKMGVTRRQYQVARKKWSKGKESLTFKNNEKEYWDLYECELMTVAARNPDGWVKGFLGYKK